MLENNLNYSFKDKSLLENALIHKSYMQKSHNNKNNERMEFLGDSVLGFTVAEYIFLNYKDLPEGELTKIRSIVVCESTLHKIAEKIGLGDKIYLGKGEEQSDGRHRPSILSDAMEAVFAAVYLDGGIESAKRVILSLLKEEIESAAKERDQKDYKTALQELIQKDHIHSPKYTLVKEEGPDHDKTFSVSVSVGDKILGYGKGHTKKEAEKNAAKEALLILKK